MAQKPPAEYRQELMFFVGDLSYNSFEELYEIQEQLQTAATVFKEGEWAVLIEWLSVLTESVILNNQEGIRHNKEGFLTKEEALDVIEKVLPIYHKAQKNNYLYVQIRTLWHIQVLYWESVKNYELAFSYAQQLAQLLATLPGMEYPDKGWMYVEIGNQYYHFRDYEMAFQFYDKALQDAEAAYHQNLLPSIYNSMGLYYRKMDDLETSNYYFTKLLQPKKELGASLTPLMCDPWEGIGKGNWGYNLYLQKEYDEALKLLTSSLEIMTALQDYAYASGTALTLANIYLDRNDFKMAKKYGDLSTEYEGRMHRIGRKVGIYTFWNKYYTKIGHSEQALAYLDSSTQRQAQLNDEFNALNLLRWEQKAHLAETTAQEERIEMEKLRASTYWKGLLVLLVVLIILAGMLIILLRLYRKKRNAYQALVKKSQDWAQTQEELKEPKDDIKQASTKEEKELVRNMYEKLYNEKLYRDPELTLPQLATQLNTNRTVLSKAINVVEAKNFSILIGELRIKDAVKLLSDPKNDKLSIDYIAETVGFNNRFTFSQNFKKITGMTPSEFRNNKE